MRNPPPPPIWRWHIGNVRRSRPVINVYERVKYQVVLVQLHHSGVSKRKQEFTSDFFLLRLYIILRTKILHREDDVYWMLQGNDRTSITCQIIIIYHIIEVCNSTAVVKQQLTVWSTQLCKYARKRVFDKSRQTLPVINWVCWILLCRMWLGIVRPW